MSEELTYDVMGNISTLNRDNTGANADSYTGNRLISLAGLTVQAYQYDANGNATVDGRNGMALTYNMLNLPATASKPGVSVAYTYDAAGRKLAKNSNGTLRQYIDGIEYNGNAIDIIHTEEGVAQNNSGTYSYRYNLSDHLGNVRYSFDIYNGAVRRLQADDYYAFGKRRSVSPVGLDNKYLYNGKEVQDELGEQYDYGARFYDPVIGRWNVVDPLAESYNSYSEYNYGLNDPIGKLDPNGMWVETATGYTTSNPEEIAAFLGQSSSEQDQEKQEDPTKQSGRNAVNKPGTIIRKSQEGYSVRQLEKGDGGTGMSDALELGVGFTPMGVVIDMTNAIEGKDRSGNELSWGWRLAGLVPFVSEVKMGTKITKVSGWVKRSVFKSLDPAVQKKVADAIKKGIVAPTGNSGIIKLTASEAKATGYTHKVKILGKGGDLRIYGNEGKNGHIVFEKVMGH